MVSPLLQQKQPWPLWLEGGHSSVLLQDLVLLLGHWELWQTYPFSTETYPAVWADGSGLEKGSWPLVAMVTRGHVAVYEY